MISFTTFFISIIVGYALYNIISSPSTLIITLQAFEPNLVLNNNTLYYRGGMKNKLRNGYGTLYYETGNIYYEGTWENDAHHGIGTMYHSNSTLYYHGPWYKGFHNAFFDFQINETYAIYKNKLLNLENITELIIHSNTFEKSIKEDCRYREFNISIQNFQEFTEELIPLRYIEPTHCYLNWIEYGNTSRVIQCNFIFFL